MGDDSEINYDQLLVIPVPNAMKDKHPQLIFSLSNGGLTLAQFCKYALR